MPSTGFKIDSKRPHGSGSLVIKTWFNFLFWGVGFGSVFFLQRVRGGKEAIIEDLIVSENYRKSGIGSLILKNLLSEARFQNCFKVSLETSRNSEGFYINEGFYDGGITMKKFIN